MQERDCSRAVTINETIGILVVFTVLLVRYLYFTSCNDSYVIQSGKDKCVAVLQTLTLPVSY